MQIGDIINKNPIMQRSSFNGLMVTEDMKLSIWYKMCNSFKNNTGLDLNNQNYIYNQIYYYLTQNRLGAFNFEKGLFLTGDIGTGKTTILNIIQSTLILLYREESFRINNYSVTNRLVSARRLTDLFAQGDYSTLESISNSQILFIDEIGREEIANNYGYKKNVISDLIADRYQNKYKHIYTFFSTNLDQTQFVERYGIYTFDRLKEMCNFYKMGGQSLRKY